MVSNTARFSFAIGISGVIHVVAALSVPFTSNVPRTLFMPLAVTIEQAASGEFGRPPDLLISSLAHSRSREDIGPDAQAGQVRSVTKPLAFPVQPVRTESVEAPIQIETEAAVVSSVIRQAGDAGSKQAPLSTPAFTPVTSSARSLPASSTDTSSSTLKEEGLGLHPHSAVPSYSPAPDYPEEARWEKRTGRVLFSFRLTEDGMPEDIRLMASSGHADLDAAARESLERWRFEVAKSAKQGATWYKYAFRFELM